MLMPQNVTPSGLVNNLKQNATTTTLSILKNKIRIETDEWLTGFRKEGGVDVLAEILGFSMFQMASGKGKTETEVKKRPLSISLVGDSVISKTRAVICCFEEGLRRKMIILSDLEENQEILLNIFKSFEYLPKDRTRLLELLAAINIVSDEHHVVILNGLAQFRMVKLNEFRALITELRDGDDLLFKISFLSFINSLIVMCKTLDDRSKVRNYFLVEGLAAIIEKLNEECPDPDLQNQIKVYNEELQSDIKETGEAEAKKYKIDPLNVISSLWNNMKGTGLEETFTTILDHYLRIGMPKEAPTIWKHLELISRYISIVIRNSSDKANLAPSDILLKVIASIETGSEPTLKKVREVKPAGKFVVFYCFFWLNCSIFNHINKVETKLNCKLIFCIFLNSVSSKNQFCFEKILFEFFEC